VNGVSVFSEIGFSLTFGACLLFGAWDLEFAF
jgi:hypothetical protein